MTTTRSVTIGPSILTRWASRPPTLPSSLLLPRVIRPFVPASVPGHLLPGFSSFSLVHLAGSASSVPRPPTRLRPFCSVSISSICLNVLDTPCIHLLASSVNARHLWTFSLAVSTPPSSVARLNNVQRRGVDHDVCVIDWGYRGCCGLGSQVQQAAFCLRQAGAAVLGSEGRHISGSNTIRCGSGGPEYGDDVQRGRDEARPTYGGDREKGR